MRTRRPAVSEVLATLILIVISVSVGVVVVSWASTYSSNVLGGLSSALNQGRFSLDQYPVIEYVYASPPGNLTLFVSNEGTAPTKVVGVILSNSSYMYAYTQFYVQPRGGGRPTGTSGVTLMPDQVVRIYVDVSNAHLSPGSVYQVTVITASGVKASTVVPVS